MLASAHQVSAGSGGSGAEAELLPFLTTDAGPLIVAAKDVIAARITRFPDLGLTPVEQDAAIDAIVRLVLSHVMQPGARAGPHRRPPGLDRGPGAAGAGTAAGARTRPLACILAGRSGLAHVGHPLDLALTGPARAAGR